MVSARESDWLVLMMVDTEDGTAEGSTAFVDIKVIGPE